MNTPRFGLRSLSLLVLAALPACEQFGGNGNLDMKGGPDQAVASRFGLIRITGTTSGAAAIATFLDMQQSQSGCLRRAVSQCVLYSCAGTSFVQPNAGTISITGGVQTVNLVPRVDGSYIPYNTGTEVTFPAAQKLLLDAPGGSVPFTHSEITPPNQSFSVTNPDGNRPQIIFSLNRQRDYRITWTPTPVGTRVHAELIQDTDTNRGQILDCDFDGVVGEGVLPTTLLSGFQLTESGTLAHGATLFVGPSTNVNLRPSGWDIILYGMANGRDAFANISDN